MRMFVVSQTHRAVRHQSTTEILNRVRVPEANVWQSVKADTADQVQRYSLCKVNVTSREHARYDVLMGKVTTAAASIQIVSVDTCLAHLRQQVWVEYSTALDGSQTIACLTKLSSLCVNLSAPSCNSRIR